MIKVILLDSVWVFLNCASSLEFESEAEHSLEFRTSEVFVANVGRWYVNKLPPSASPFAVGEMEE